MDVATEINRIETRLRNAGVSVSELLKRADINGAQWWKWRQGKHRPLRTTWARIERAADEIAPRGGHR